MLILKIKGGVFLLLLKAQNIEISFGINLLFQFDKFEVFNYDRVGIVGKNGSGKTTLLNILGGELEPDTGIIKTFAECSYFRQFNDIDENIENKNLNKNLSGGEATKIFLADVFNRNSPLLFLDEPTSNLNISSIKMLEKQILNYNGAIILISHDRKLLENICTRIIDIENNKAIVYECGYEEFVEIKQKKAEREQFLYEAYDKERKRLVEAISETKSKSKSMRKTPKRMGNSEARLHKRAVVEKSEKVEGAGQSLQSRLERLEVHEKPKKVRKIGIELKDSNIGYRGKYIVEGENICIAFGDRVLLDNAIFRIETGSKTVIIGDNGCGKTTLIRKILAKDNNIKVNAKKIGYYAQNLENLYANKTILENVVYDSVFTELEARNILGRLGIREDNVYKKVQNISGGEKVKVCFAKIFTQGADLVILDEPTNYLDIDATSALEEIINEYNGTVLTISHDRSFIENIGDIVIEMENKSLNYVNLSQNS